MNNITKFANLLTKTFDMGLDNAVSVDPAAFESECRDCADVLELTPEQIMSQPEIKAALLKIITEMYGTVEYISDCQ